MTAMRFHQFTHIDGHSVYLRLTEAKCINRARLTDREGKFFDPDRWATKVDFSNGLYVLVNEDVDVVLEAAERAS